MGRDPPAGAFPFAARVDWVIDQATANRLNVVINVQNHEEMDKTRTRIRSV